MDGVGSYSWAGVALAAVITGLVTARGVMATQKKRKPRYDLDKIPCPPGAVPYLGHMFQLAAADHHRLSLEYTKRHGSVVRVLLLGEDYIMTSDPEIVAEVLSAKHNLPKSDNFYVRFEELVGGDNLLSHQTSDEAYCAVRKTMALAFSNDALRRQFGVMRSKATRLIDRLKALGPAVDVTIDDWMIKATFDILCATAFGMETDALSCDDVPYLKAMEVGLRELSACSVNLFRRVLVAMPFTEAGRQYRRAKAVMDKVQREVLERLLSTDHPDDDRHMGAQLTRLKDSATGKTLTIDQLMPHFTAFFIAGFETTSHTVAWTLLEIACHPRVQAKIHDELRGLGLLASEHNPAPTIEYAHFKDLVYLNQVLKESMRVNPVAAGGTSRRTLAPMQLGPYKVPEDTLVWVTTFAVHNSPHNYLQPEEFLPERWGGDGVDAGEGEAAPPPPPSPSLLYPDATLCGNRRALSHSFLGFSEGPRSCVGTNMGYLQARLLLAMIMSSFKVDLALGRTRKEIRSDQIISLTMHATNGIPLRFTPLVASR